MNRIFITVLFSISVVFALEYAFEQEKNLNVPEIKKKARVDAKADFARGLVDPPLPPYSIQLLPEHREDELLVKNTEYQKVYRSTYEFTIKIQRLKKTLFSPESIGNAIIIMYAMLFFLIGRGVG